MSDEEVESATKMDPLAWNPNLKYDSAFIFKVYCICLLDNDIFKSLCTHQYPYMKHSLIITNRIIKNKARYVKSILQFIYDHKRKGNEGTFLDHVTAGNGNDSFQTFIDNLKGFNTESDTHNLWDAILARLIMLGGPENLIAHMKTMFQNIDIDDIITINTSRYYVLLWYSFCHTLDLFYIKFIAQPLGLKGGGRAAECVRRAQACVETVQALDVPSSRGLSPETRRQVHDMFDALRRCIRHLEGQPGEEKCIPERRAYNQTVRAWREVRSCYADQDSTTPVDLCRAG